MATDELMSAERLAELRQALDDAMLTHTGRSIGDLASQQVVDAIRPQLGALYGDLLAEVKRRGQEIVRLQHEVLYYEGQRELLVKINEERLEERDQQRAELAAAQATIARLRPVVDKMAHINEPWWAGDELPGCVHEARAALAAAEGEAR